MSSVIVDEKQEETTTTRVTSCIEETAEIAFPLDHTPVKGQPCAKDAKIADQPVAKEVLVGSFDMENLEKMCMKDSSQGEGTVHQIDSETLGPLTTRNGKFRKSAPLLGPAGGENSSDFAHLDSLTDVETIKSELGKLMENKLDVIRTTCVKRSYFDDDSFTEAVSFIRGISRAWKNSLHIETRKDLKVFAGSILVKFDCFSLFYRCLVDIPQVAERTDSDSMVKAHWEPYNFVWTICVNNTDTSMVFAIEFGKVTELLGLLKEHLLSNYKAHYDQSNTEQNERVVAVCSKICHNLAQMEANRRILKDMNFVEVLNPYLTSPWDDFRTRALLTLAYILDEEQNAKYLADRDQLRFLLSLLQESVISAGRRCEGWSTDELLRGVARLAINDANKKILIEEGVLRTLVPLLSSSNIDEQRGATKTVFLLGFDKSNQKSIIQEAKAIDELLLLRKSPDDTVRQNAQGALWVLRDELEKTRYKKVNYRRYFSADGPDDCKHVMISYQWKDQEIMKKVKDKLSNRGYKVWMDIDQMRGSILETMADAVENASVVLVCLSQKYKDSPNCRAEAEYAFQLHRDIVPLKLERGYRPDGWLGILVGSRLYFDLTRQFEVSFENLVRELSDRGRAFQGPLRPVEEEVARAATMDYPDTPVAFDLPESTRFQYSSRSRGDL